MKNEVELRANAIFSELQSQRDYAFNRCAELAGELAVLREKLPILNRKESVEAGKSGGNGSGKEMVKDG